MRPSLCSPFVWLIPGHAQSFMAKPCVATTPKSHSWDGSPIVRLGVEDCIDTHPAPAEEPLGDAFPLDGEWHTVSIGSEP